MEVTINHVKYLPCSTRTIDAGRQFPSAGVLEIQTLCFPLDASFVSVWFVYILTEGTHYIHMHLNYISFKHLNS